MQKGARNPFNKHTFYVNGLSEGSLKLVDERLEEVLPAIVPRLGRPMGKPGTFSLVGSDDQLAWAKDMWPAVLRRKDLTVFEGGNLDELVDVVTRWSFLPETLKGPSDAVLNSDPALRANLVALGSWLVGQLSNAANDRDNAGGSGTALERAVAEYGRAYPKAGREMADLLRGPSLGNVPGHALAVLVGALQGKLEWPDAYEIVEKVSLVSRRPACLVLSPEAFQKMTLSDFDQFAQTMANSESAKLSVIMFMPQEFAAAYRERDAGAADGISFYTSSLDSANLDDRIALAGEGSLFRAIGQTALNRRVLFRDDALKKVLSLAQGGGEAPDMEVAREIAEAAFDHAIRVEADDRVAEITLASVTRGQRDLDNMVKSGSSGGFGL